LLPQQSREGDIAEAGRGGFEGLPAGKRVHHDYNPFHFILA
jgi:hypothetical protein